VGAIKRRKGYDVSLAAFALLQKRLPQAEYCIIGPIHDRKYYEALNEYVREHRLRGVKILGEVSDDSLREYYGRAGVFVLTPQVVKLHFEGFGLVYLEAGAFGCPVVCTGAGGVGSAVRAGETGFVLAPDDVAGVADALYRLLTEPETNRRMGLANRDWAEKLTWEYCAQNYCQLYKQVAGFPLADPQPNREAA
jgi:glycosyltransferase involved in cell wall biosynthesis